MTFLNFLQNGVLLLLIASCFWILWRSRSIRFGLVVTENGKVLAKGSQGMQTTLGRNAANDIRLKEHSVSRYQATSSYVPGNGKTCFVEYGKHPGTITDSGYGIAGHSYLFSLPKISLDWNSYGFLPFGLTLLFIILRAFRTYGEWQLPLVMLPHLLLILLVMLSFFTRADRQPVTELLFSSLLTFYIDASLFPASFPGGNTQNAARDAVIGVSVYIICFLATRFFFGLPTEKIILGQHSLYDLIRFAAALLIPAAIVFNLIFARKVAGTLNWVSFGGYSFQPSEFVKAALVFSLVSPGNRPFFAMRNLFYMVLLPGLCLAYGLIIKDIGFCALIGVVFIVAIVMQCRNVFFSFLLFCSALLGCKGILMISATASSRFAGWMGQSGSIWDSLTGSAVFESPLGYGFQPVHAIVSTVKNGGLLGNNGSFNILSKITAANSDLVMAFLAQKFGYPLVFLILAIWLLLVFSALQSIKQQTIPQIMLACLALSVIIAAYLINLGGTFAITPLSGIVAPALSDGISSAVCYGCLFGALSTSALTPAYLKAVRRGSEIK